MNTACRNGKCCRLAPEDVFATENAAVWHRMLPAPQACCKKKDLKRLAPGLLGISWGEDYSHSIVAFGFGDMS